MGIASTKIHLGHNIVCGGGRPFVLIAGPCQLESRDHALMMADTISAVCKRLHIPFVFKTSFDKANRTSVKAARGLGLDQSLPVFDEIEQTLGLPVCTDVHEVTQVQTIAEHVSVLQVPALLCRQTDLLCEIGSWAHYYLRAVNIKKGQFMAPADMKYAVEKVHGTGGGPRVLLTERGSSFGYNTLVNDMRALPIMQTFAPVCFDATHSVQSPGGLGGSSGGQREYVPALARAAVAVGVDALFMEVHQDPDNAPSDGPCMLKLDDLHSLLSQLIQIDRTVKKL